MVKVSCPKCGFQQDGGSECLRCGIIFERYRQRQEPLAFSTAPVVEEVSSPGLLRNLYRIFRWLTLAGAVGTVFLILRQPEPPHVAVDAKAAQRLQLKLSDLERAREAGRKHTLRLQSAEINSWVGSNLASQSLKPSTGDPTHPRTAGSATSQPTLQEVQSSVRDFKVDLTDDRVRAYVVFDFHGVDLWLTLEGRLRVDNGYLRLEPTRGQFGSLPLPQSALQEAVQRLFSSPENKEKFKLPPDVADIHVEEGELVVAYQ